MRRRMRRPELRRLRLRLRALGLFLCAGCSGTGGSSDTSNGAPPDGGRGGVMVNLDGGGAPATPPNGVASCPAGCNYQSQTGCASGTNCVPTLSTTTIVPACVQPGTVAASGACTAPTDCVAGHICAAGLCRKLCCGGDWTGCDSPSEHCIEKLTYETNGGMLDTHAMLCFPVGTCNALEPTTSCTTAGTTCQIVDATGATACIPDGTGTAGQTCPCKGGFACVIPPGKSPVCVRLCGAVAGGAAPYCEANEGTCTHYNRDPEGVGECQP